jgi:hypothetical protein
MRKRTSSWPYYPGGDSPADFSPLICCGDTITSDVTAKVRQGAWVVGIQKAQNIRPATVCFGRVFFVGGRIWVFARDADAGYSAGFVDVDFVSPIVSVKDPAGRERARFQDQGNYNTGDARHRFETVKRLVKLYSQRPKRSEVNQELRKLAAELGRIYLALRRWMKQFGHVLYPAPSHNWKLPRPRRTIRARVA